MSHHLFSFLQDGTEGAHVSHAERAAHRTECRRLTKFVRLCDALVLDTLVSMSLERAVEMLKIVRTKSPEELEADRDAVKAQNAALVAAAGPTTAKQYRAPKLIPLPPTPVALYAIDLQLSADGQSLQFSPHLAEFQARMEQIIRDSVSTLMVRVSLR